MKSAGRARAIYATASSPINGAHNKYTAPAPKGNGNRGGVFYVSDMKFIFTRSLLRLSLLAERIAFFLLRS